MNATEFEQFWSDTQIGKQTAKITDIDGLKNVCKSIIHQYLTFDETELIDICTCTDNMNTYKLIYFIRQHDLTLKRESIQLNLTPNSFKRNTLPRIISVNFNRINNPIPYSINYE